MKKQFTLALALLLGVSALAQKSYVKLQVGYGLPLAGSVIGQNYSGTGNGSKQSNVSGSYGSGLSIEGGYGYSITPLLSTQVDFTYLMGKEYTAKDDRYNSKGTYSSKFVQVAPLLRFDVGDGKIHPYAAIGPVFGFGTMKDHYFEDYDGTYEEETKYSGSVSVGVKSALGLEMTKGKLGFFVQATMVNMSYAPSKSELTKRLYDGQDQLAQMSTYDKKTEYVNSVTPGSPVDPNKPRQELKNFYPLSSLALSVGARFKF